MPKKVKAPGMVIFVAILMFIAGGFSILGCVCGGGSIAMLENVKLPQAPGQPDPMALPNHLKKELPGYYPVLFTIMGLDGVLGLAKIILGIGLLRLSSTARLGTMMAYVVNLLLTCISGTYNGFFVLPTQGQFLAANPVPGQEFTQPMGIALMILGIVLSIAVSIMILVVLNLRSTKEAFLAASQPPTEEEDSPRSRYEGYDDDDDDRPRKKTPKFPGDTGITEQ
jgi:hypothetical protein